jgi:hypothetical protein
MKRFACFMAGAAMRITRAEAPAESPFRTTWEGLPPNCTLDQHCLADTLLYIRVRVELAYIGDMVPNPLQSHHHIPNPRIPLPHALFHLFSP